jgi:hypothetical protein
LSLHVLGDGLRRALREVEKKLAALAEDSAQEARHGEDDVTMRDRLEHFLLQPLRPQELLLLFACRTEAPAPTRKRAEHGGPTGAAPKAREAVLDQATCEEPAQHALDDGAERAMLLGEALRVLRVRASA